MSAHQLSIDFGTSRSKMAWFNPQTQQAEILRNAEGETETPSVVGFEEQEVLVGKAATSLLEHPETASLVVSSVKRDLGRNLRYPVAGNPTPVEVAAHILAKLKRDAEEGHFHEPVSRAVITHPATFDQVEKDRLKQAAQLAGFAEVELLPEPVAAALAYARAGFLVGKHVLVYDLGAGTFDLALLVREENETNYRLALDPMGARIGGDDFDRALYDLCNMIALATLGRPISPTGQIDGAFLYECRQRKENLSLTALTMFRSYLADGSGGVQLFRHEVKREAFEGAIKTLVEQTVRQTESLLRQAENAEHAVESLLLIGGSSRIPLVATMLSEHLSVSPQKWEKQDVAVALGAAYAGQFEAKAAPTAQEEETNGPSTSSALPPDERLPLNNLFAGSEFAEFAEKYERDARARRLVFLLAGRTGVGKSSTVNSLMGRVVAPISHSQPCTFEVRTYDIDIQGTKIQIVDTPGLCDQLEETSNDDYYIQKMRKTIGQIDALLYVTDLQKRPPDSDEIRALRVLSKAFEKKGDIWRTAVIAFTHANTSSTLDIFQARMKARTRDFHNLIAGYVGERIAKEIPIVAVENTADQTLDGKDWRAELYTQVCLRISNEGFPIFLFATEERAKTQSGGLLRDEDDDRSDRSSRRGSRSKEDIHLSEQQADAIRERLRNDFVQKFESGGRVIGSLVGLGDIGASVGRKVGSWLSKLF